MTLWNERKLWFSATFLVLSFGLIARLYYAFVPRGAEMMPFIMASVNGGTLESPQGKIYEIWFNDAGAAHSGNHWTWITTHHPLLGKSVVTEGYLTSKYAVDRQPLEVMWNDETPVIEFASSRYED